MNSIKVRTNLRSGTLTVRMLVRHPMNVGGRVKDGDTVAAHFIEEISCEHNGETVMQGHWGPGIAKNPYLSFVVGNAQAGDVLAFRWLDNRGGTDAFEMVV